MISGFPLATTFGTTKCDPTGASNVTVPTPVPATEPTVTMAARSAPTPRGDAHTTDELVVHDTQLQMVPAINCTVAVPASAPKLSPETVTDDPPLTATFGKGRKDAVGASNVKIHIDVPTVFAMVVKSCAVPTAASFVHMILVVDDHEAVSHVELAGVARSHTVAVYSLDPKLRPVTVIAVEVEETELKGRAMDNTAASNETRCVFEPTTIATVTTM